MFCQIMYHIENIVQEPYFLENILNDESINISLSGQNKP